MRRIRTRLCALCGALVVGATSPVLHADPMQCGTKIVDVGMTMAEVRRHCGEPTRQESELQDVRSGNRVVGTTTVHRWYYTRAGATRMMTFDNDQLIEIN